MTLSAKDATHTRDYQPIHDYALIGDCHGSALVASDGSIDWCCLGRFDAEPALWRLLDAAQGASFTIQPTQPFTAERAYLPDTNILRTVFTTASGRLAVTDFMPVGHASQPVHADTVSLNAPGWLVRVVEGLEGYPEIHARYQYATYAFDQGFESLDATPVLFNESTSREGVSALDTVLTLGAGERQAFVIAPRSDDIYAPGAQADRLLGISHAYWEQWCRRCCYSGTYGDPVRRSALTLKALNFAPTGAIVAAPTTSLPEAPGGVRNWDYRFTWLRDSSFVLQALGTLGYSGEARGFCEFLRSCCMQTSPKLQILYGISGQTSLDERSLDHLAGYRGARPVRVGNAAYLQTQIDIYGELADWAWVYHQLGGPLDGVLETIIREVADHVVAHWQEPDQGIWEMRGEPRHHVYSKAMAWVALDRALRLLGRDPVWETARDDILQAIVTRGVDSHGGALTQAFGHDDLDAALLLLPMLDIPIDSIMLEKTVSAVEERLRVGDFVHRYLTADGLSDGEGAFLICSFWLVDALLVLGRAEEARALYERLLGKANDVGLYAEESDPTTGLFLGNYPQAFTHLALVNSALHLQLYDEGGVTALAGTHADRARRVAASLVTDADNALWRDSAASVDDAGFRNTVLELQPAS